MNCQAAVRRPDLRQCKRRAVEGGEFCSKHAKWPLKRYREFIVPIGNRVCIVQTWTASYQITPLPRWLGWLRWLRWLA